jgi:hypothetical protein
MSKRTTHRIERLLRRALRIGKRAAELYTKKNELIELAVGCGLELNTPIELDGEQWMVLSPEGKWVHFHKLEIKKVPKYKRSPAPTPQPPLAASTSEGV